MRCGSDASPSTQAERVGEPAGGVDGDDDRSTASAGRFEADHRSGGRLADAPGAAAHDHRRRVDQVVGRPDGHGRPSRASTPASASMSLGASPATSLAGSSTCASGSCSVSRAISCASIDRRDRRNAAAAASATAVDGSRPRHARSDRCLVGEVDADVDAVHHDRPQLHADLVLEREGGLDHLVDRGRLRQRHQHHLTALRIVQQLEHVVGLCPNRTRPDRISQAGRSGEERDGVAGRRAVDHDEVVVT